MLHLHMLKQILSLLFFITCNLSLQAIEIVQKPIVFDEVRKTLTLGYIKDHYGISTDSITIVPKIVVIHHTASNSFTTSFNRFVSPTLPHDRADIANASQLNVSAHYLIDQNGTIYQLMPETTMARHVIGLNYSAIGIENVGGQNFEDNLTNAQLKANIALIEYLQKKYPTLEYLIGHYEYRCFERSPLWLERDSAYRTVKHDPSKEFMQKIKKGIQTLKGAPCD